jgi:hypothetical protein
VPSPAAQARKLVGVSKTILIQCSERDHLRAESSRLFAECEIARDELKMLKKTDPSWKGKKNLYDKITGQLREAHKRFQ